MIMKLLVKLSKYGLYSLILAVLAAGLLLGYVFLRDTAREISRPEFTISTSGAGRDISRLQEELEQKDKNFQDNIFQPARAADLPQRIAARLEQLPEHRSRFRETEIDNRIKHLQSSRERELNSYSEQRRQQAEELIAAKQSELESEIIKLERDMSDRELEVLEEVRRQARGEYSGELLNLRIKLRTLDLSQERREEIEQRVREIESRIEARVDLVRRRLESRLEQERLRQLSQLEQSYNRQIGQIIREVEADLEQRRAEIEQEISELRAEKEETWQAEHEQDRQRWENQLQHLQERYLKIYGAN